MLEKPKPYNLEQAENEASKMEEKIKRGKAKDYNQAERKVELDELGLEYAKETPENKEKIIALGVRDFVTQGEFFDKIYWSHYMQEGGYDDLIKLNSPKIEEAKQARAAELLNNGDMETLERLEGMFGPIKDLDKMTHQLKNGLIVKLKRKMREHDDWNHYDKIITEAQEMAKKFNISDEIISSPEVVDALKTAVITLIQGDRPDTVKKAIEFFKIPDNVMSSNEVKEAIKQKMLHWLGHFSCKDRAINIDSLDKSKEIQNDPEIKEALKIWFASFIKKGRSFFKDGCSKIKNEFPLFEEFLNSTEGKKTLKERLISDLSRNDVAGIGGLKYAGIKIPLEILADEEVQQAAIKKMNNRLDQNIFDQAIEIRKELNLPNEIIQHILEEKLVERLLANDIYRVLEIKNNFPLSEEFISSLKVQKAVKDSLVVELSSGSVNGAFVIKDNFPLPENFISSSEIQQAAKKCLIKQLDFDNMEMENVNKIKNEFNISKKEIEVIFMEVVKEKDWRVVSLFNIHFLECQPLYQNFLTEQKQIAKDERLPFAEKQKAFDALAGLAENGELSISNEFSEIIKNRSEQKENSESKWGLDQTQEAAFYTLMRLDNPESNQTLFSLLKNENINNTIKYATLKKLSSENRNFLNHDSRRVLREWLADRVSGRELDWQDLNFIVEILKIPSTETRNYSLANIDSLRSSEDAVLQNIYLNDKEIKIKGEKYDGKSTYEFWQNYKNIPQNTFLQLIKLTEGDKNLLDKFDNLYTVIRKENTKKENLLYGIVNSLNTNSQVLSLMVDKLKEIDFSTKEDADSLSELLRQFAFLNKVERIHNYQNRNEQLSEISEVFSREAKTLEELTMLFKEIVTKKIQELLPNKNITGGKIESIEKEWSDLEPIFTYLGRYPQLKKYIAEMVVNFDNQENWKNWRYDLKSEAVEDQIGHLTNEQLEMWQENHFSEIGNIMIAESGSYKPKQIQNILHDAIITHKHIFNSEMGQNNFEYVQKTVENTYSKTNENPDKKEIIIEERVKEITTDTKSIDAIINFNNLPKIKQSIESVIPENTEIQINKKTKDTINFLTAYLSKELSKTLDENYKQFGDETKTKADELITPEIRNALNKKIEEIEVNHTKVLDSDIWERLNLDKNNLKNVGQFYQKRQELKAIIDLLRLSNLSNKLIATNKIVEKEGKKGGETIIGVIDTLKKFFKDSPLLLDLKNIEFALKEKIDFGEKRRLAMVFTDNPQMLWQAGKYPLGNGSCQHYAEGGYANQLMGYVGDANCKVAYLVDLNKLSADIKQKLEEKGFEEIKDGIPAQELLNASLARSIIKMTKGQDNEPVILLEPTYTVVYKGDASMDKYYNIFIDLIVADPMKAKMARGEGKESISKGSSRSPEGQYEDLSLSSVKFIHKLSKITKEDMKIMEKIRSSR